MGKRRKGRLKRRGREEAEREKIRVVPGTGDRPHLRVGEKHTLT